MSSCVIVQTAYLGDVILTTPLVRAAAEKHDFVAVVTTPTAAQLLEADPHVDRVIPFDKRSSQRGVKGLRSVAAELREMDFQTAYLPHRSIRSALAIRLAGIPERIGFDDSPARWHYTRSVTPVGQHEAERTLSLIDANAGGDSQLHLCLSDEDRARASESLKQAGIDPDQPFVCLAPGSVWFTKRWPHYTELAGLLAAEFPVVVIGIDRDSIVSPGSTPHGFADLCGRLAIRESASVIARAAAAVTNDSAPLHMAQAMSTPTVALFGPTTPEQGLGPRGARDLVLGMDMECRPCSIHGGKHCPLKHHDCMVRMTPERVAQAVVNMMEALN